MLPPSHPTQFLLLNEWVALLGTRGREVCNLGSGFKETGMKPTKYSSAS